MTGQWIASWIARRALAAGGVRESLSAEARPAPYEAQPFALTPALDVFSDGLDQRGSLGFPAPQSGQGQAP